MIGTLLTKSAFGELRSMLERHREMTNGNADYLGSMPQPPYGPDRSNPLNHHHHNRHLDHPVLPQQNNHKPLFRTFETHDLHSMGSNTSVSDPSHRFTKFQKRKWEQLLTYERFDCATGHFDD